jgi:hypothetical protein
VSVEVGGWEKEEKTAAWVGGCGVKGRLMWVRVDVGTGVWSGGCIVGVLGRDEIA